MQIKDTYTALSTVATNSQDNLVEETSLTLRTEFEMIRALLEHGCSEEWSLQDSHFFMSKTQFMEHSNKKRLNQVSFASVKK